LAIAPAATSRWLLILASIMLVGAPVCVAALTRPVPAESATVARRVLHQTLRGDSLQSVLAAQGFADDEIARWQRAARPITDLRRLQSGRALQLELDDGGRLLALRYELDDEQRLSVERAARDRLTAHREPLPVRVRTIGARATVGRSIKDAALGAGIPDAVVSQLVDLLGWRLDFKEDVHRGDRLRVLWEQRTTLEGRLLPPGRILAVEYEGRSDSAAAYYFAGDHSEPTYVDEAGNRLDGAPLRYPLEFSRITSAFSDARLHPILHRNRPHLGVDFAAPSGTPVRAIGPGVVQFSGRQSGFGNHVEVDHGGRFLSAYSHLQKIADGVAAGHRVARGQLLGWVGQTGLATGPHLHFAVFDDGQYVDPLTIKYPSRLGGVDETESAAVRRQLAGRLRALPQNSPATPTAPEMGLPALALSTGVGPITLTF
jgi:murein DD-endopeptidase MepM/ murein hydrolase activator NlpD